MAEQNTTPEAGTAQGNPGAGEGDASVGNKTENTQASEGQQQGENKDSEGSTDKGTQLTSEVKPEAGKTQEADQKAPESYEKFNLPEGFAMDDGALELFSPVAKEMGLPQDKAQKLIDLFAEVQGKNIEKLDKLFAEDHQKSVDLVRNDPELGGDNYDSNLGIAKKVLGKFGNPGVIKALDGSGLGDNPEVIRMLVRIGKSFGEDTFVDSQDGGGQVHTEKKTDWYPNMNAKT